MNPWAAIVGRTEHGKHEATLGVMEGLRAGGFRVGGALQVRAASAPPKGTTDEAPPEGAWAYDLLDLATGARIPVAKWSRQPEICDYRFEREALERGRSWVLAPGLDAVLLEVGHLEARGEGHWPAVLAVLSGPPRLVLLRVRPDVLFQVTERLPAPVAGLELPVLRAALDGFVSEVVGACATLRGS